MVTDKKMPPIEINARGQYVRTLLVFVFEQIGEIVDDPGDQIDHGIAALIARWRREILGLRGTKPLMSRRMWQHIPEHTRQAMIAEYEKQLEDERAKTSERERQLRAAS